MRVSWVQELFMHTGGVRDIAVDGFDVFHVRYHGCVFNATYKYFISQACVRIGLIDCWFNDPSY